MEAQAHNLSSISNIIPHNGAIRQARLPKSFRKIANSSRPTTPTGPRKLPEEALRLYDLGLNVFPQPPGRKSGLPWKRLRYTRLDRSHPTYGLGRIFEGRWNLAVMCGRTSGNLFVIDCETPGAFAQHMQAMRERGIAVWAASTARGGHLYLRCTDGEVQSISAEKLGDYEIRGGGGYVLAPPSVHPSGAVYEWLHQEGSEIPTVTSEQVDWLRDKSGLPVRLQVRTGRGQQAQQRVDKLLQRPQTRLSRSTQEYLAEGHNLPEGTRNNRLFRAACDMAGNGFGHDVIEETLSEIAMQSGLGTDEVQRTIHSALSRERTPSRPQSSKGGTGENWHYAAQYVITQQWAGARANSKRAVLMALIERAKQDMRPGGIFRASVRETASIARVGTRTAQTVLNELEAEKVIRKKGRDAESGATLWAFTETLKDRVKKATLSPCPPWSEINVFAFNALDSVERGALGYTGLYVYRVLVELGRPALPQELSRMARLTVNQVNYALKKLRGYGLVSRVAEGWVACAVSDAELEQRAAGQAGTLGRGEARRQRFVRERALYAGRELLFAMLRWRGWAAAGRSGRVNQAAAAGDFVLDELIVTALELGAVVYDPATGVVLARGDGRRSP